MGRLLTALVDEAAEAELVGLVTEPGRELAAGTCHPRLPVVGQDRMADALPSGCVVIDFSLAPALEGLLAAGRRLGSPLVVGTTGFTAAQDAALAAYAAERAVVRAANFSIGIPTLRMLLQLLARTLPGGFDAEQIETHHVTKKDRPSGTAAHLAGVWRDARGGDEVPTHSQRLGGVIGEHTWTFSDQEETLVLTHRAHSRRAFLRGVMPAVRFAAQRPPGLYDLTDVLQGLGQDG
jgi:4-hydroxy-tetrahydrodipicolinate reductase